MRRCTSCNLDKPETEYNVRQRTPLKLDSHCKTCKKRYRLANRAKIANSKHQRYLCNIDAKREYNQRYWVLNKQRTSKQHAAWEQANPDAKHAHKLLYYKRHKSHVLRVSRSYYQNNKTTVRLRHRLWSRNNPDLVLARWHRYRARRNGASGRYTPSDIMVLRVRQNGLCFYCYAPLTKETIDHKIPLSRGGSNWPDNLVLACVACNSSKCDKTPEEFNATPAN